MELSGVATHSHIRIVPRDNNNFAEDSEDYLEDTPIFRSSSLQFPPNSDEVYSSTTSTTNGSTKTTYAGVMRRFNKPDFVEGEERPTSSPISLAGLVKLQSNRKKGKSPWRPIQLSDFGEHNDNNDGDGSDHERVTSHTEDFGKELDLNHRNYTEGVAFNSGPASTPSHHRASPFDLPQMQTNTNSPSASLSILSPVNGVSSGLTRADSEDISPSNIRDEVVENYVRVFGKRLPDPIFLSEEIGRYEGHVIFIGHPNRDVSAHQWSVEFFRWLNIGLYSHIRRRIEGSLAADRLRSSEVPQNTIEYFKAVAEKRQDSVRAGARLDVAMLSEPLNVPRIETLRRPTPTNTGQLAPLPGNSGSTAGLLSMLDRQHSLPSDTAQDATPTSRTVTRQVLEDPFVTPARKLRPVVPNTISFTQHNDIGIMGSMDFDYEFPSQQVVNMHPSYRSQSAESQKQMFIQQEQDRLEIMRRGSLAPDNYISRLSEVQFGEEAVSEFQMRGGQHAWARLSASMPSNDTHDRQKFKNRPTDLVESEYDPSNLFGQRVAAPELHTMAVPARTLFPPPGLTVANPNRVVSTLNAKAKPYTFTSSYNLVSEAESEITAVHLQPKANLKFSEPESIRHSQSQEIANGLSHQAPTLQVFKGPFFTNDIPTAHNINTSRAFPLEASAKLEEWFRGGERSARQQEYAKSIMATAHVDAKARNGLNFGTIGNIKVHDPGRYANTPIFVRLYEHMLQYLEESQVGETKDPFTRAWKAPSLPLRDLGTNGNSSFFDCGMGGISPLQTRISKNGQQPLLKQPWGKFGSVDSWPKMTVRSVITGNMLGGPKVKRV